MTPTPRESAAPHGVGHGRSGDGPVVVLVHSSVSGRRQWRSLTSALEDRFQVVAIDLIGYGDRPPWGGNRPQQLSDQSALIHEVSEQIGTPLALVGHSFGASVALCAAAELGNRLDGLVCSSSQTRSPSSARARGTTSRGLSRSILVLFAIRPARSRRVLSTRLRPLGGQVPS